jgi:hypothetical protein
VLLLLVGCKNDTETSSGGDATDASSGQGSGDAGTTGSGSTAGTATGSPQAGPVPVQDGIATLNVENTKIQFVGLHMPPKAPDPRTGGFASFNGTVQVDTASKTIRRSTSRFKRIVCLLSFRSSPST